MVLNQSIIWQSDNIPKAMVKYAEGISLESVVDIEATVVPASEEVQSCSQKHFELQIIQVCICSSWNLEI